MQNHEQLMDEALALAVKGRGWTSPNPIVGALVVKDGAIVGRGWHKAFGGPHAEVFALQEAGEKARGATLYCTLEPCNHQGKTPPCSQAVIKAGIARVVLGALDTNSVASGGIEALKAAGIEVTTSVRENECRAINAPFFKFNATQQPFVTLKWAMSADGKIATASGDSKWISSEASRAFAHRLRAAHDAVLVGIGTLIADGARLNCRIDSAKDSIKQPRRVILDSNARTPSDAPIFSAPGGEIIIVTKSAAPKDRVAALKAKGAQVISIETLEDRLPLGAVLKELAQLGIRSILVEGGSKVLGAFLDAKLADEACIFLAPILIGGEKALSPIGGTGCHKVTEAIAIKNLMLKSVGDDCLLRGALSSWQRSLPDLE